VTTPAQAPVQLAAPTNLQAPAALVTTTSVTLTWSSVTGATGYTVQRSSNGGTTWVLAGTAATTTYRVTGLTTKTPYQFRVIATNGNPAMQSQPSAPPISVTTK
jgi:hypothetical protein